MDLTNSKLSKLPQLPEKVNFLNCSENKLTNLFGSPKTVMGDFKCFNNKLTNLAGSPDFVGGNFSAVENQLTSVFGAPKIIKGFYSSFAKNPNLSDVSNLWNSDIIGDIYFDLNLGMALLPVVKFNFNAIGGDHRTARINDIARKHMGSSKQNILDFQYDLIENDFSEYAKWKP